MIICTQMMSELVIFYGISPILGSTKNIHGTVNIADISFTIL